MTRCRYFLFYHQYFSFLTLLMFNSIDFSLPPSPRLCPHFAPYIENRAAAHAFVIIIMVVVVVCTEWSTRGSYCLKYAVIDNGSNMRWSINLLRNTDKTI